MRFIHTSDWHLGRTLHGESLLRPQRAFLEWLTTVAVDRRADAVLVAGDVYDRAVPSTDAVQLLDDALAALAEAGIPVMMTSGNHDSAIRLGFGSSLQRSAGVHIRTRLRDLTTPLVLRDDFGEVAVYGVPYLLPDAVMDELDADRSHASVLRAAVGRVVRDAADRGITRTVALAHAFVTGAVASESERDIRVGGIGDAPGTVFDGCSFAALGHLHAPQQISDRVAYSGSPLAFSFAERHHTKSVTLVELDAAGGVELELLPVPVYRPLYEVRGRLADLLARADTDLRDLCNAWVKAVLTDPSRPLSPMELLRQKWPHTLVLDFQPDTSCGAAGADLVRVHDAVEPVEICAAFVEWVDSTLPTREQRDAIQSAVEAVARAELSA